MKFGSHICVALLAFIGGFFSAHFTEITSQHNQTTNQKIGRGEDFSGKPLSSSPLDNRANLTDITSSGVPLKTEEGAKAKKTITLPAELANRIPAFISFSSTGEIQLEGLALYGVPPSKWIEMKAVLEKGAAMLQKCAIKNSILATRTDGDSYFKIKPFVREKEALRKALEEDLRKTWSDGGDVNTLLSTALTKAHGLAGLGGSDIELWTTDENSSSWVKSTKGEGIEAETSASIGIDKLLIEGLLAKHIKQ